MGILANFMNSGSSFFKNDIQKNLEFFEMIFVKIAPLKFKIFSISER
jgi:hypothetical protein